MRPAACITSATDMRSQAAVSTQEGLRAEVAAAVVGEEVGLSLSVGLGMTLFHAHDSAPRNPVPAHPILSSLWKKATSAFFYLFQEKKMVFLRRLKLNVYSWVRTGGQRAVVVCSLQLEEGAHMF